MERRIKNILMMYLEEQKLARGMKEIEENHLKGRFGPFQLELKQIKDRWWGYTLTRSKVEYQRGVLVA